MQSSCLALVLLLLLYVTSHAQRPNKQGTRAPRLRRTTIAPNVPIIATTAVLNPLAPLFLEPIPLVPNQPAPAIPTIPTLIPEPQLLRTTSTTTAKPVTLNPLVPPGQAYGAFGQLCTIPAADAKCTASSDQMVASDMIACDKDFDCCMCEKIYCAECKAVIVGTSSMYGVSDIVIYGIDAAMGGALVLCKGMGACARSNVVARNIKAIECTGLMSCNGAIMRITDPVNHFILHCIGVGSCQDLSIELLITAPEGGCMPGIAYETISLSQLSCIADMSCDNLQLTINNQGCSAVQLEELDCEQPNACTDASLTLLGDVEIVTCQCGASCQTMSGVEQCFDYLKTVLCPDAVSCQNVVQTLLNPLSGFILKCSAPDSCANAKFTIIWDEYANGVDKLDAIGCSATNACAGATFVIENKQQNEVILEKVECTSYGSCAGATFVLGNGAIIKNFLCNQDSCPGCLVKRLPTDAGVPCEVGL